MAHWRPAWRNWNDLPAPYERRHWWRIRLLADFPFTGDPILPRPRPTGRRWEFATSLREAVSWCHLGTFPKPVLGNSPAEPDEAPDFSGLGTGNVPAKDSIRESSGIATEKEPSTAVSISQGIAPRWHLRAASLVLGLIRGRRSARILGAAPEKALDDPEFQANGGDLLRHALGGHRGDAREPKAGPKSGRAPPTPSATPRRDSVPDPVTLPTSAPTGPRRPADPGPGSGRPLTGAGLCSALPTRSGARPAPRGSEVRVTSWRRLADRGSIPT